MFSVGLEPTTEEMLSIFDSLSTQSKLSNELAVQRVRALFENNGIGYDALRADLTFWRTSGVLRRSDNFVWLGSREYFWKRTAVLNLPALSIFLPMVPKYTVYEKGIYTITKNVMGGMGLVVCILFLVVLLMCATDRLKWVGFREILTCYSFVIISWAAQAGRESMTWSSFGRRARDDWSKSNPTRTPPCLPLTHNKVIPPPSPFPLPPLPASLRSLSQCSKLEP